MSLKEAVLEIVQNMEDDLNADALDWASSDGRAAVKGYARALKSACKAAADVPQGRVLTLDATSQHILEIEKARAEFRKDKKTELKEEEASEKILEIMDGPLAGDSHLMPANMPEGAKTSINGETYQLRDGKLWHCPDGV